MLYAIKEKWNNDEELINIDRHMVHLFTKRSNTGTGGIAYVDVLCDNLWGYGFSSMLDNDTTGAWGLVVNKPLASVPLGSLIHKSRNTTVKEKELYNVEIPVFWGGPVHENKILVLHSQEYQNETTKNFKNLSVSSDYKILFEIADKKGPKKSLIILGISSWGPGQLEGEMEMEKWVLSEINTDLIFKIDNAKKWLNAINSSFMRL